MLIFRLFLNVGNTYIAIYRFWNWWQLLVCSLNRNNKVVSNLILIYKYMKQSEYTRQSSAQWSGLRTSLWSGGGGSRRPCCTVRWGQASVPSESGLGCRQPLSQPHRRSERARRSPHLGGSWRVWASPGAKRPPTLPWTPLGDAPAPRRWG